jgi:hypothetical protein
LYIFIQETFGRNENSGVLVTFVAFYKTIHSKLPVNRTDL